MDASYFTRADGGLMPTPVACSLWSTNQLHGVALSTALSRAAEHCLHDLGREELVPARWTVDLFRPATMDLCELSAVVVREGPRICLIDALLVQKGQRVARAGAVFLKPTGSTPGRVWSPDERPAAPPEEVVPRSEELRMPFFHSEAGWSQEYADHQNGSRKQTWQTGVPVVPDERPTPFQVVAGVADATSMVTNWGTEGIEYINTDITLALARPPQGLEVGLVATDRLEYDGVAVGTASVHDRSGPLGTSLVTCLANSRRVVDPRQVRYAGARRVVQSDPQAG